MGSSGDQHKLSLYAMTGGDGSLSYVQNSTYQKGVLDVVKPILEEEIATKLQISTSEDVFCIADFGCSTGTNSFGSMQIIIRAVEQKYESSDVKLPEFFVFFNDMVTNDFNTLFSLLPPNRSYTVAAVPGYFHRRLLPPSSIHFGYSSWALHWLSGVPKAVVDRGSPAWNGGEILYSRERKEVCDAYLDRFERDIKSFLECRAVEMVDGGIMTLLLPGVPEFVDPEKEYTLVTNVEHLTSCLMDMAKEGKVSEAEIDSFNIPYYFPTFQELQAILESSHSFIIERMEILINPGKHTFQKIRSIVAAFRAVHEGMLADHFGDEIIDELFDLLEEKLAASPAYSNTENDKTVMILVVLKRMID